MTNTKYPDSFELVDRSGGNNVQVEYDGYSGQYEWTYASGTVTTYSEENTHNLIDSFYDVVKTEPELVFPFTFVVRGFHTKYKAVKTLSGAVCVERLPDNVHAGWRTVEEVKKDIKDGLWVVKSVGDRVKLDLSPKENVSSLTIKVDSSDITQATANMNALAQAVENVNISLESMQTIMGRMMVNDKRPVRQIVTLKDGYGNVVWTKECEDV